MCCHLAAGFGTCAGHSLTLRRFDCLPQSTHLTLPLSDFDRIESLTLSFNFVSIEFQRRSQNNRSNRLEHKKKRIRFFFPNFRLPNSQLLVVVARFRWFYRVLPSFFIWVLPLEPAAYRLDGRCGVNRNGGEKKREKPKKKNRVPK